ncbi:MAG: PAS domain S-box protein, partial [Sedimentisphaerales bacterium]|nr:PAS domain S-box protein [Sedimentisphaerales bacterium]
VRWIRALGNTIYDKDGRPLRMSGICLDITRRKLTEEALHQRGEDLARAQEVGNIGSWRLDTRKNVLTWSDENHRIFGIPKDKPMTYETFLSRVHPEDRDYVDTRWKAALTGEPYDIEHRLLVDGQVKWVREKAYLEFDKDGSLIGGFGITQDITDRKKAEEEIKNLALFPSENPYPILRVSSDGVIMHSNPPGLVLLKKWDLTVYQKAPAQWRTLCKKALHSRQTVAMEVELEGRTISLAMVPVAESGYVNLYGRDITVEKQAQKALQESHANMEKQVEKRTMELAQTVAALQNEAQIRTLAEEQLRERSRTLDAFFAHSLTPLVILDRNFNFIRVNKAYAEACERDINEFAGHNHFAFYPHEENQHIFEEVIRTKTAYQAIARPFSFPDHPEWGTTYWDWSLVPIQSEAGEVEFLVFALEDVTEATTSRIALAESEQRFRLLAESIEDVFWMSTPGIGKMIYVSPAYEKIWGRSRESLYENPRSFLEGVHPKDRDRMNLGLQRHAQGLWDFEYRIVRPDGNVRWVRDRGFPIRNEQGQLFLMCGVASDITVRRQAEEKLRANQKALRSLTAELSVMEERERRAIAVDLHDSVGQILAFAARELEMLRRTQEGEAGTVLDEVRAYLDQAIRETRTLSFDLSPSALYDLGLEAALEDLAERLFKDKGIQCSWNRNGQPALLEVPIRTLLYRSVRELLINIVKHAQARHVEISLEHVEDHFKITVQDDGRGFDMADLYWRGSKPQGFGLLSIRERLRHLGGRFQMQSSDGNGTTITLITPISLTDANGGKNQ